MNTIYSSSCRHDDENFKKKEVAYLGNVKNNVAVSLMIICAKLGYDFIGIGPEDYAF